MSVLAYFVLLSFFLFNPRNSEAIILMPAVILIPIAKLIALFITGFILPVTGIGVIYSKYTHKPVVKILIIFLSIMIVLALIAGVILKIVQPHRSLL